MKYKGETVAKSAIKDKICTKTERTKKKTLLKANYSQHDNAIQTLPKFSIFFLQKCTFDTREVHIGDIKFGNLILW